MERVLNAFAAAYVDAVIAGISRFIEVDEGTMGLHQPEIQIAMDQLVMARRIEPIPSGLDPVRFAELFNHTNYAEDFPLARRVLGAKRYQHRCVLNIHGQAMSVDLRYKLGCAMGVVKTCDETIDPTLRGVTLEEIKAVHALAAANKREPDGQWWRDLWRNNSGMPKRECWRQP